MTALPELMTIKQVADYLQVSISTVRRMLADGRLNGFKVGRAWRIPREAVAQLLNEGVQESRSPS